MADLAEAWGWGPPIMEPMTLADLLGWRSQALERRRQDN